MHVNTCRSKSSYLFQIIVSIVQRVSAHFPCTWEDALDFRRDHIGTTEQAVRALIYLKNQNRNQINSHQNQLNLSGDHNKISDMNQMSVTYPGSVGYTNSPNQATQSGQNSRIAKDNYVGAINSRTVPISPCYNGVSNNVPPGVSMVHSYQPYWTPESYAQQNVLEMEKLKMLHSLQQRQIPAQFPNEFIGDINASSYIHGQSSIPTGSLVEIQSPPDVPPKQRNVNQHHRGSNKRESSSSSTSTLPGQGGPIPVTVKQLEDENRRKSVLEAAATAVTQGTKNSLESWDYVYRQLENSGYSKDQADRPDVLEHLIKQLQLQKEQQQYCQNIQSDQTSMAPQKNRNEYEAGFNDMKDVTHTQKRESAKVDHPDATHRRFNLSHKTQKSEKFVAEKRATSAASKYLNTAEFDESNSNDIQFTSPVRAKSSSSLHHEKSRASRYNKPLDPPSTAMPPELPPKGRHQKLNTPSQSSREQLYSEEETATKWECQFCTFLNDDAIDVCEICAKSRLVSESSRTTLNSPRNGTSRRSQSALSQNSSRQTTTQGSSIAYYSEEEDFQEPCGGIECNRCTLVNDRSLKVCEACGASLGLDPIEDKPSKGRNTSKSNTGIRG